jgi:phage portal protein BeeE
VGKQPPPDVPGGMRPRLTDAQQRQIIGAILKRYQGTTRHGEPIILDGLIEDLKRLSNTPEEMDWLNSGKITKARIFQGFGVNPIIAGEVEGANRASAGAADKHFIDSTVNPKITLLSQTMTEWLGPMFGGITVWIEPCIADDADLSFQWAQLLSQAGAISTDELRALAPFPLPENPDLAGRLVTGQGLASFDRLVAQAVHQGIGAIGAENIMAELGHLGGGHNGNGRF